MLIEIGHVHASNPDDGNVVSVVGCTDDRGEDGAYVLSYVMGTSGAAVRDEMFAASHGATPHFGGNTLVADVVNWVVDHPDIGVEADWVAVTAQGRDEVEADDFERFLAEFLKAARGKPDNVEDTHWTLHDSDTGTVALPPGVHPDPIVEG